MTHAPGGHARGDDYQARFDALAASGTDVHGEVAFVLGLDPVPRTVLDAGCGTGRVAIELHRRGVEVVGTDIDADMLATARRLGPHIEWVEADLAHLDLGRTFDAVVLAGNVLLFVAPGSQPVVLERCAAHLAAGGAVVAGFGVDPARYDLERLDADVAAAGLRVAERHATWDREPFAPGGHYAVTVLRTD